MNLERMKQLAGVKLNESVSAVPGIGNKLEEKSKSEKQARFMAAAAHDPEFAKKTGMDSSVAKEFNKADTGTKQLSNAMKHKTNEEVKKSEIPAAQRKAKGGDWKVSTDDLKKENPTNKEFMDKRKEEVGLKEDVSAEAISELSDRFAAGEISYDEFKSELDNLEQADYTMRQGEMGMMGGDTAAGHRAWGREQGDWNGLDDNEYDDDQVDAELSETSVMEDNGLEDIIAQKMQRLQDLSAAFVDNHEAFDTIAHELAQEGYDEDDINMIMDALHNDVYGSDPEDNMSSVEADADALASAGWGTDEDYGDYGGDMYEELGDEIANTERAASEAMWREDLDNMTASITGPLSDMEAEKICKQFAQGHANYEMPGSEAQCFEFAWNYLEDNDLIGSEEEEDDDTCRTCDGTGIGQYGDPDTSRCPDCRGRGFVLARDDDYDAYDDGDYVVGEAISLGDPELGMPAYYLVNNHTGAVTAGPFKSYGAAIADKKAKHFIVKNGIHTVEYGMEDDDGQFTPADKGVEEAYDFNNGYYDINDATGSDYFPDGADSPVTKNVGPSGARQGDNPEQKRMQVAEVHKELVYSYRNFLKESKSKK